jgi:hypothetical protein
VRNHNNNPPAFGSIAIPAWQRRSSLADKDVKAKGGGGGRPADFDDEQLFRVLRREYARLRRPWRRIISMRTLKSLALVCCAADSFESVAASSRAAGSVSASVNLGLGPHYHQYHSHHHHPGGTPDLSQQAMLEMYRCPRRGRRKHVWTNMLRELANRMPGSSLGAGAVDEAETPSGAVAGTTGGSPQHQQQQQQQLALEFREGWSPAKLAVLAGAVCLASVGAGVLWIVFGLDAQGNGGGGVASAGARFEAGVLLAGVVLLLGWTLLGACALLGWLIM